MSVIPPLSHRIVRVVIRYGGTAGVAAAAIGCSKDSAYRIASKLGLRFMGAADRRFDLAIFAVLSQGQSAPLARTGFRSPKFKGVQP